VPPNVGYFERQTESRRKVVASWPPVCLICPFAARRHRRGGIPASATQRIRPGPAAVVGTTAAAAWIRGGGGHPYGAAAQADRVAGGVAAAARGARQLLPATCWPSSLFPKGWQACRVLPRSAAVVHSVHLALDELLQRTHSFVLVLSSCSRVGSHACAALKSVAVTGSDSGRWRRRFRLCRARDCDPGTAARRRCC
jgi:hypothetical protein